MAFTSPLPPAEEVLEFYEGGYTVDPAWREWNKRTADEYFRMIEHVLPRKSFHFLEIGGAYGYFSAKVQSETGARVTLLECGRAAAAFAREHWRFEIVPEHVENFRAPGQYDVIYSAHVVEHLSDINLYFSRCYDLLAPGGRCVILTPNAASWKFRCLRAFWCWASTDHLHFLSSESARIIARRAGFEEIECWTNRPSGRRYPGLVVGVVSRLKNLWKFRQRSSLGLSSSPPVAQAKSLKPAVGTLFRALNAWARVERLMLAVLDFLGGADELLLCVIKGTDSKSLASDGAAGADYDSAGSRDLTPSGPPK